MGTTVASVLLKLFVSGNENCHTNNDPYHMNGSHFSNVNNEQSMIPDDQKIQLKVYVSFGVNLVICLLCFILLLLYDSAVDYYANILEKNLTPHPSDSDN